MKLILFPIEVQNKVKQLKKQISDSKTLISANGSVSDINKVMYKIHVLQLSKSQFAIKINGNLVN